MDNTQNAHPTTQLSSNQQIKQVKQTKQKPTFSSRPLIKHNDSNSSYILGYN